MSMRRSVRSPRHPFDKGLKFGRVSMVHRQIVCPGETITSLSMQARYQSLPVRHPLVGCWVDVQYFYVPMRVVWDGWEDFILNKGGTIPKFATPTPLFFDNSANPQRLAGMAYEHIINTFYRTDEDAVYSYAGEEALSTRSESLAETKLVRGQAQEDQDIDITDGLSVKEIDDAYAQYRYETNMNEMSGHYSDYLSMHGVDARRADVLKAERIARVEDFVFPSKSIDPSDGTTTQSYFGDLKARFDKRRAFPEHGYIIGLMTIRPRILPRGVRPVESCFERSEQWPHPTQPDALRDLSEHVPDLLGINVNGVAVYSDSFLLSGAPLTDTYVHTDMVKTFDPSSPATIRLGRQSDYDSLLSSPSTLSGGAQITVTGFTKASFRTPLRIEARS